jgi:RecA/RadA recombinase
MHFKPDDSEQVSDQMLTMARSGLLSAVAVDSIGSMESGTAFEKEAREYTVGRNAQIITRMLKQLAVLGTRHEVTSFLVNQYRANIGVLKGPTEIPAGPKALKYATSMRVSTKKGPNQPLKVKMDDEEEIVGYNFAARVERSKVSAQGRSAQFWILNQSTDEYGEIGVWTASEALALGKKTGVLTGTNWIYLPDGTKHNGEDKTRTYLARHPEVCDQIRDAAVAKVPTDEAKPEVAVTYAPDEE